MLHKSATNDVETVHLYWSHEEAWTCQVPMLKYFLKCIYGNVFISLSDALCIWYSWVLFVGALLLSWHTLNVWFLVTCLDFSTPGYLLVGSLGPLAEIRKVEWQKPKVELRGGGSLAVSFTNAEYTPSRLETQINHS